ncbi:mitochondrial protein [Panus rudis PR-1116 ss-1]|nr:mitochondrial protein [Panus rudis PR-1116 ss-1]
MLRSGSNACVAGWKKACMSNVTRGISRAAIQGRHASSTLHIAKRTLHSTSCARSLSAALKPSDNNKSSSNAAIEVHDLPISRIDDRKVVIGFNTGEWARYHHIWLRDHCRCPECFHSITKQRLVNTFDIPKDVKPVKVESKADGLEVHWPSSKPHTSFYPWSWLRHNSYDPPLKKPEGTKKILWGSKIVQSPPSVPYTDVVAEDDKGLYKWLSNVDKFGFSFVSGVPATTEATEELAKRIGFIRETQYGKFWDFTSDLAKGDTAYTTLALGAHTDNTYFTDPCGLQLFHLLSHTEGTGGQTLLVDGFYVASLLKELHPTAYEILSRVGVPAHAAGEPDSLYTPTPQASYPVLRHALSGELVQVRWNNDDRSVMNGLKPDELEEWYDAVRLWHNLLTSADSEFWVQLSPGTAVVVDNHRVLHGRSAFTGKRRMCGAYIGVDEYKSKLAVLQERFSPDPITLDTADSSYNGRSVWHPAL